MFTKDELKNQLPKVGDIRREIPNLSDKVNGQKPAAAECVVVEVNRANLWYRVRFTATGFYECYKVPRTRRLPWEVEPCNIQK